MSIDTFMKQLFGEKKQVQYLSGRRQVGTVKHLVVDAAGARLRNVPVDYMPPRVPGKRYEHSITKTRKLPVTYRETVE